MITIHRAHGLRVVIFSNDHEPAHVHVFGDSQVKINLIGPDGAPQLVWAEGAKRSEVRRAMRLVIEQQAAFLGRWREFMADLTDTEIDVGLQRGRVARENEPRAAAARYDRASGRVIVDLENGCVFAFPPRLVQGLEGASDDQLADIEILGRGYGLGWRALDVDFSLPGLMAGAFGTASWMARRAGRSTSVAKAAAARANGAKGGRPRKAAGQ